MSHYLPSPEKMKQFQQAGQLQQQQGQSSAAVQIPGSPSSSSTYSSSPSNSNQNSFSNYNYTYKQQQLQLQQQKLQQQQQNQKQQNQQQQQQPQQNNQQYRNSSNLEDNLNMSQLLHTPIRSKPPKLKVSYSVGNVRGDKHCFGINSLVYDNESNHLYSAGRDSTVKLWSVDYQNHQAQHKHCFEGHTDWVNDIFVNPKQSILVTGSSDSSIKVWNTNTNECIKTERRHEDYVKALAYAPTANHFASSGLDSHIVLWDLNVFTPTGTLSTSTNGNSNSNGSSLSSSIPSSQFAPQFNIARAGGDNISIYSLAINNDASLVLAGSTERTIRAWDIVGGKKIFKLKGHSDNVRSIIISPDNRRCLSASSDGSFRLWDLGLQKCIHSFDDVHADSVWSLAVTPSFSHVYSGGRDGLIYSTDLKTFQSTLICKEASPILKVVHDSHHQSLWVSTTDSEIKNWSLNSTTKEKIEPRFIDEDKEEAENVDTTSILNANEPVMKIPGRPGIIKHHIMNNRRHVLTKDTNDSVQLWDITKGKQIGDYGKVDFDKQINEIQEIISIPKWLSVDTKTGNINITMEPPHCFAADANLSNLGVALQEGEPDFVYNLGERVLSSLFSHWLKERQNRLSSNVNNINQPDDDSKETAESEQQQQLQQQQSNGHDKKRRASKSSATTPTSPTPNSTDTQQRSIEKRMIFELPKDTSIVIFDENNANNSFRIRLNEFTGLESFDVIPRWVSDCLFGNPTQKKEATKDISFTLSPSEEKNISSMPKNPSSKFQAPPYTQVKKLLLHVSSSLKLFEPNTSVEEYLEILCDNKVLLHTYSLATIRAFFWKSSEDIPLVYRVKQPYSGESELRKLVKLNQIKKIVMIPPTISANNNNNSNGKKTNNSNDNSANSSPQTLTGQNQDYVNGKNKSSPMISTTSINVGNNGLSQDNSLPPSLSISSSPKPSISTTE